MKIGKNDFRNKLKQCLFFNKMSFCHKVKIVKILFLSYMSSLLEISHCGYIAGAEYSRYRGVKI